MTATRTRQMAASSGGMVLYTPALTCSIAATMSFFPDPAEWPRLNGARSSGWSHPLSSGCEVLFSLLVRARSPSSAAGVVFNAALLVGGWWRGHGVTRVNVHRLQSYGSWLGETAPFLWLGFGLCRDVIEPPGLVLSAWGVLHSCTGKHEKRRPVRGTDERLRAVCCK
jgi:hypothetical protein